MVVHPTYDWINNVCTIILWLEKYLVDVSTKIEIFQLKHLCFFFSFFLQIGFNCPLFLQILTWSPWGVPASDPDSPVILLQLFYWLQLKLRGVLRDTLLIPASQLPCQQTGTPRSLGWTWGDSENKIQKPIVPNMYFIGSLCDFEGLFEHFKNCR